MTSGHQGWGILGDLNGETWGAGLNEGLTGKSLESSQQEEFRIERIEHHFEDFWIKGRQKTRSLSDEGQIARGYQCVVSKDDK